MFKITDNELWEGVLGSAGWVLFFLYFRNSVQWPSPVEGFLAWTFLWWGRKVGMRMYKDLKTTYKWKNETLFEI